MKIIILYIILYLVINAIPALFIAINAEKRKMKSAIWFLIVCIFSFIGIVIYIIVKDPIVDEWVEHVNIEIPAFRSCPKCSAYMIENEKVCRLCGYTEEEVV